MQNKIHSLLLSLLMIFLWAGVSTAQGTPLTLGPGQELCISLGLEPGKSYEISLEVRTALQNAAATMTLRLRSDDGQVLEEHTARSSLSNKGDWTLLGFAHFPVPYKRGSWELLVSADQAGLYYWQSLKVLRSYDDSTEVIALEVEPTVPERNFFTGLVVDARHLDVQRGISPRIYAEGGQLLYGGVLASQEMVQELGVVAYGKELTPELLRRIQLSADDPYVNPLIVEAIGVADPARTGVYVSAADAQRILQAMAQYDFFARFAVIFLIN